MYKNRQVLSNSERPETSAKAKSPKIRANVVGKWTFKLRTIEIYAPIVCQPSSAREKKMPTAVAAECVGENT